MSNKLHLQIDLEPMGVPYEKPNDTNEPSRAYVDLKVNPEKTATLPELKRWPEAEGLIQSINATEPYKTVGVGAWLEKKGGITRFVSYLQFCFDDRATNENAIHYYYLFHQFALDFTGTRRRKI